MAILTACDCASPTKCRETLQAFLPDNRSPYPPVEVIEGFSIFNEDHMHQTERMVKELMGLDRAELVGRLGATKFIHSRSEHLDYLTRRVLLAQDSSLILPPVWQTLPKMVFKQRATRAEGVAGQVSDPEIKLNWWREDPGLAIHHHNWHTNYPTTTAVSDRQGELFAYMHEQMLARYDFERLALGMNRVRPYGPGRGWDKPLPEGYNARMKDLSFRPANMSTVPVYRVGGRRLIHSDEQAAHKDRFLLSIARGYLEDSSGGPVPVTMHLLGCTVEANMGSVNKSVYGNLHNNGHVLIASINDPEGDYQIDQGPMGTTLTAQKDPVFFRWHKFVDSLFEAFRVTQTPYGPSNLKNNGISLERVYLQTVDTHPEGNTLKTFMTETGYKVYNYKADEKVESTETIERLQHVPFRYLISVKNDRREDALVVFRVFLAPGSDAPLEEVRTTFVEMDKFVERVEGGGKITKFLRNSEDSSVILPHQPTAEEIESGVGGEEGPLCGCGWPSNLLVPRGTHYGMEGRLFVIATDWSEDGVGVDPEDTLPRSVSYCGKRDAANPDKRPMGFPFDRRMEFSSVEELVEQVPNAAFTTVTIRHYKTATDATGAI